MLSSAYIQINRSKSIKIINITTYDKIVCVKLLQHCQNLILRVPINHTENECINNCDAQWKISKTECFGESCVSFTKVLIRREDSWKWILKDTKKRNCMHSKMANVMTRWHNKAVSHLILNMLLYYYNLLDIYMNMRNRCLWKIVLRHY